MQSYQLLVENVIKKINQSQSMNKMRLDKKFGLLIIVLSTTFSCGEDAPLKEEQRITNLLSVDNWAVNRVQVDGQDKSNLFVDFSLRFNKDKTYTTTGTTPVWPRSGTWNFKDVNNPITIVREDGLEVLINSLTESKLELELVWEKTTISGGKEMSVRGRHVFALIH